MVIPTPPDSVVLGLGPTAPAAPERPSPPPRASWRVWLRRDAVSTVLLFFIYFYVFTLLSRDLVPRDRLWAGAWAVVGACQLFIVLCVVLERGLPRLWPFAERAAVVLFVGWHLFFLVFRNPLDLWNKPVEDWCAKQGWWKGVEPYYDKTDRVTRKYGNFFGIEQGWKMFPPPLARSGWFLESEITFDDNSVETLPSDNEPDLTDYVRVGGWRGRKLETYLEWAAPEELHGERSDDLPIFAAFVRWRVRRWRESHPDDPRTPVKVKLVRHKIDLPQPGDDPTKHPDKGVTEIGAFDADGRLQ